MGNSSNSFSIASALSGSACSRRIIGVSIPPGSTQFTRIPLWRDESENIIGVLHSKDLLRAIQGYWNDIETVDIEKALTVLKEFQGG